MAQEIFPEGNAASITGELDSISGWVSGGVTRSTSAIETHNSSWSIVAATQGGATTQNITWNPSFVQGNRYQWSVWAKAGAGSGTKRIEFFRFDDTVGFDLVGTDWQEITYTGVADFTTASLRGYPSNGTDTIGDEIYIDQVSCIDLDAAGTPTLTSATVENAAPNDVVMVFDDTMTGTNLGFTLSGTTSTTFASISGSGTNTITGVLATPVTNGEIVLLSYDSVVGDLVGDTSGLDLASFTDTSVTNNVSAPAGTATVEIEWIDSISAAATGNKIYRDDVEIADIANGIQIYQDATAETGTEYKYEVQAYDGVGGETTLETVGVNTQFITTA